MNNSDKQERRQKYPGPTVIAKYDYTRTPRCYMDTLYSAYLSGTFDMRYRRNKDISITVIVVTWL